MQFCTVVFWLLTKPLSTCFVFFSPTPRRETKEFIQEKTRHQPQDCTEYLQINLKTRHQPWLCTEYLLKKYTSPTPPKGKPTQLGSRFSCSHSFSLTPTQTQVEFRAIFAVLKFFPPPRRFDRPPQWEEKKERFGLLRRLLFQCNGVFVPFSPYLSFFPPSAKV